MPCFTQSFADSDEYCVAARCPIGIPRRQFALLFACWMALAPASGCWNSPPANVAPQQGERRAEAKSPPITPRFVEVTEASGVSSAYHNHEESGRRAIVESLGGGVGVCDYDRDGRFDLFFPGGGTFEVGRPLRGIPGTLWRNRGDMRFANATAAAAIDQADHYSHGCAIADCDNDGFPDILVTGYGGLNFFRNLGDGTFVECRVSAGLTDDQWSSSAAWGDFNGDGDLDLYVVHYVDWSWTNDPSCPGPRPGQRETCSPMEFKSLPDVLYFSQGDGTFRRDDSAIGPETTGKGLGVIAVDVNQDCRLDVYVANDTTPNLLFINQGAGRFEEQGVTSGTAFDHRGIPNGSMGLAVLDYDGDLRPDLWVTNYEKETFALYRNDGGGNFRCLTENAGIAALGTLYVGFGTVAADFTRSGVEDLVVSNGHIMHFPAYSPVKQEPLYLRNNGRARFVRQTFPNGDYFSLKHVGRGVIAVDLDQDGKLDLVFSHTNAPAAILQQQTELQGSWVELELIGRRSNRDAIGSRVVLESSRGKQLRMIVGGGSYLSQNPYTVNFGLPPETSVTGAQITWPDGAVQELTNVPTGAIQRVLEP
jgi:ASPIC and UnbV./FG-GAP repeat.